MAAKNIFRIDDVCENMVWENFHKVKEIFLKNEVRPLLGVIPFNEDESLQKLPKCNFDFWEEIRRLQNEHGWHIALHGYNHVYATKEAGILNINKRSEFSGLSYEEQYEKIRKGIEIFKNNGVRIDAFMAPAHSFDDITVQCLLENQINTITDGYSFYPYYEKAMLYIPQLFAQPRKMPFGVYTWCLHTNATRDEEIERLRLFVLQNARHIISLEEAKSYIKKGFKMDVEKLILRNGIIFTRKLKNFINRKRR